MHADFLSRVQEAKARYTRRTGEWPEQLFLGPKEYMEFREMCSEDATFRTTAWNSGDECAGLSIIGLMSDVLMVGRTVE